MSKRRTTSDVAVGGGAGVVATLAMSGLMLAAQRLGFRSAEQPPERIVEAALDAADVGRSERTENVVASAAHLVFGATCAVGYRLLRRAVPTPGPAVLHGVGYGLGLWAASYAGWIPALGILRPPHRDTRGRQVTMVLAHVVYGAIVGALAEPPRHRELEAPPLALPPPT